MQTQTEASLGTTLGYWLLFNVFPSVAPVVFYGSLVYGLQDVRLTVDFLQNGELFLVSCVVTAEGLGRLFRSGETSTGRVYLAALFLLIFGGSAFWFGVLSVREHVAWVQQLDYVWVSKASIFIYVVALVAALASIIYSER